MKNRTSPHQKKKQKTKQNKTKNKQTNKQKPKKKKTQQKQKKKILESLGKHDSSAQCLNRSWAYEPYGSSVRID